LRSDSMKANHWLPWNSRVRRRPVSQLSVSVVGVRVRASGRMPTMTLAPSWWLRIRDLRSIGGSEIDWVPKSRATRWRAVTRTVAEIRLIRGAPSEACQ
jgi:hypothetical protein